MAAPRYCASRAGYDCNFRLQRDRTKTSIAIWIPVVWLALASSRNVGEWIALGQPMEGDSAYLEGNPVDRAVLGGLMVLGIAVLIARRRRTWALLRANAPVAWFFIYCGMSSIWSDYFDVSSKRWVRGLGDLVMVLVVLTERDWLAGANRWLTRVSFLLLPISVLFIRYYPNMGRTYGRWDGKMVWTGVTTGKNSLGMICMLFGLVSVWRLIAAFQTPHPLRKKNPLIAHAVILATAVWLLWMANSVTSIACLVLGSMVMFLTSRRAVIRRPALIHGIVATVFAGAFCVLFLGIGTGLLTEVGRDSTLTGRTDIWQLAISLSGNPLIGTGYESFWLGPRLDKIRTIYPNHVNQVHNGYLEIFLNLGWLGVLALAAIIVTGYPKVITAVRRRDIGSHLRLAFFVVAIIYNFTEGAFKMMAPIWICFLLAIMAPVVRKRVEPARPEKKTWGDTPEATSLLSLEEV